MAILGAHMSMAGGYYKAVEAAKRAGCDCVQLFTKNNNQWAGKPITGEEAARFKESLANLGIGHPISHNSYLINLASPDNALWEKSIDAMVVEVQRAELLGIPYIVAHPGAYTTSSEELGLVRIVAGLDEVHAQTAGAAAQILLETTSGQGSCLGCKFEQLATILGGVADPDRLGVCVDTCHIFSAGYAMETEADYKATMKALDKTVGVKLVRAFEVVGSILVVAMLIIPPATAHLLADRLAPMVFTSLLVAIAAAILGYILGTVLNTNLAGMITVAAAGLFGLAVLFSPQHGVVSALARNFSVSLRVVREDLLAMLYRLEELGSQRRLTAGEAETAVGGGLLANLGLGGLLRDGRVARNAGRLDLTPAGREAARQLVRSHRLWETYLVKHLGLPLDHVHEPAHRIEHFIGDEMREQLQQELDATATDPHGREIPE